HPLLSIFFLFIALSTSNIYPLSLHDALPIFYIPYFTSLAFSEIVITLIVFAFSVAVLCYVSYKLAKISFVSETLEKYERIIVPIVFIGLGIYILIENGTIQTLLSLFN